MPTSRSRRSLLGQSYLAIERALKGVEGAYLMMPPSQTPSPDFREAKAEIILEKEEIKLSAINQFKIQALEEIVLAYMGRAARSDSGPGACEVM